MADESKKEEIANQKKIVSLTELMLKVEETAASEGLSAKKKDQLFQKLLNDNMAGTKALLSEGGNISQLSKGMTKALVDSYRATGEELDERDEKRNREDVKLLVEIAFQSKKSNILKALEDNEISQGMANLRLATLETGHFFEKGWLNFQDKMADAADIKNLGSAISQDFSMLTTEFQGLMALPGMKTIVTGIKFIAAWLGKWLAGKLMARWKARTSFMRRKKPVEEIVGTGGPLKKDGSPDMRYAANRTNKAGLKGVADTKDIGGLAFVGPDRTSGPAAVAGPKTGIFAKLMEQISGGLKKLLGWMATFFSGKWLVALIKGSKAFAYAGMFFNTVIELITIAFKKAAIALWKGMKLFVFAVGRFIRNAMLMLIKGFLWAAKGILLLAKRMMIVIGQFLAAAYLFIAGTLIPAIVAFLANPMTWLVIAIIAGLILIAVQWYFIITYLMNNWEKIKVLFGMAGDRLKLVGTKIANWFTDLGSDISFMIKKLIAKIKDGFVWIVNATIEGFAKAMPDGPVGRRAAKKIRSFKMTGGYSDEVDAERAGELDRRSARDTKLEADFEAKYAERGKQLEEAKIKEGGWGYKKEGQQGANVTSNSNTNIDQRQSFMTTESTKVPDNVTLDAIMQHG